MRLKISRIGWDVVFTPRNPTVLFDDALPRLGALATEDVIRGQETKCLPQIFDRILATGLGVLTN